jgi:PAS domain S-box-containing protein
MLSVMEPDGRVTWANEVALNYLGISLADLGSDDWRARVIHPDDLQEFREERQRVLANGVPFESEQRLCRHDGQFRWCLVRYQPLKDAAGRVVRWYGGAIDIENRKRAEEALRQSEASLAEGQKLSHTGSWAVNISTGEIIHSSDEHSRLYGFDPGRGTPSMGDF